MSGELDLDDPPDPFQPKPFCDSEVLHDSYKPDSQKVIILGLTHSTGQQALAVIKQSVLSSKYLGGRGRTCHCFPSSRDNRFEDMSNLPRLLFLLYNYCLPHWVTSSLIGSPITTAPSHLQCKQQETITRCFYQDQPSSERAAAELLLCSLPGLFIHRHMEHFPCADTFLLECHGLLFRLLITTTKAITTTTIIIILPLSTSALSVNFFFPQDTCLSSIHCQVPNV